MGGTTVVGVFLVVGVFTERSGSGVFRVVWCSLSSFERGECFELQTVKDLRAGCSTGASLGVSLRSLA